MNTQYLLSYIATRNSLGPIEPMKVEDVFEEKYFQSMINRYKILAGMEDVKDLKISKRKVIYTEWEEIEL